MAAGIFGIVAGVHRSRIEFVLCYAALVILALLNWAVFCSKQQLVLNGAFVTKCENYWGVVIINRKMPSERTSHLRYVDVRPWSFIPKPQGMALDCDGRETRVLANIERKEVEQIIAAIHNRFPALR